MKKRFPQVRARPIDQGDSGTALCRKPIAKLRDEFKPRRAAADNDDIVECIGTRRLPHVDLIQSCHETATHGESIGEENSLLTIGKQISVCRTIAFKSRNIVDPCRLRAATLPLPDTRGQAGSAFGTDSEASGIAK
jgi:hypothetical protein